MGNQKGEIIIGVIVVVMVAMMTMMFAGMPMMHGAHQHGGADQQNANNDCRSTETIRHSHECDKVQLPAPLHEKSSPAL